METNNNRNIPNRYLPELQVDPDTQSSDSDYTDEETRADSSGEFSYSPPVRIRRNRYLTATHEVDPASTELHSYLGAELQSVSGRTVLEDNAEVMLEMLHPADVVLMPGQTLPLTVFDPPTIDMLRSCLCENRTFGVVASWTDMHIERKMNNIGTTAEIYEYMSDEGSAGFRVKAKARQRFRLLDTKSRYNSQSSLQIGRRWKARVKILPEVKLPDSLASVRLRSLDRHRTSPSKRAMCRRADAAVTRWPAFVFEQYNVDKLKQRVQKEMTAFIQQGLGEKEKETRKVVMPNDPTDLSFWVAQNMPMKEKLRIFLLRLNSPIQRLRLELGVLHQYRNVLCCHYCRTMIGEGSDIFCMSTEGPQGTYVNPGGYLHETLTLYKVREVYSVGPPSTEFSWFPGYAWSICKCKFCNQHVGWKFTATAQDLRPAKFWGICRRSIRVKMTNTNMDRESNKMVF